MRSRRDEPMQRFVLLLFLVGLTGCVRNGAVPETRPVFFVAVEPHAYLLEKIGGDRIHVDVLVPTGVEPENYEATPQKMAALSKSRALFLTGMPFEEALVPRLRSLAKDTKFVDLREGLTLRTLELHGHAADHSTGHEHHADCSHDGLDPHIWFAPTILKKQAETILNTLIDLDPPGEKNYRDNYDKLLENIEENRTKIAALLESCRGETVFVFHPSYGYFCDEFGLKQRAIEFEGRDPKPQQLAEFRVEIRRLDGPPIIFVQPEFNESPAKAIAEATGAHTVQHSSLQRDVLRSMLTFAEAIAAKGTAE